MFPGPDAHVERGAEPGPAAEATAVEDLAVQVTLATSGPETTAQAVLVGGAPDHLDAVGRARRNPEDSEIEVVGDEVAVARALHRLADRLIDTAEEQISDSTGEHVRVHA